MKVITSIYLNCRPDLRDEWLTGNEVDDVSDAQVPPPAYRFVVGLHQNTGAGTSSSPFGQVLYASSQYLEILSITIDRQYQTVWCTSCKSAHPSPSSFGQHIPQSRRFASWLGPWKHDSASRDPEYC